MINHRYKMSYIWSEFATRGYIVKHTATAKLVVRSPDDKKRLCEINYETMHVIMERGITEDEEFDLTVILENCESIMAQNTIINTDYEKFTVV